MHIAGDIATLLQRPLLGKKHINSILTNLVINGRIVRIDCWRCHGPPVSKTNAGITELFTGQTLILTSNLEDMPLIQFPTSLCPQACPVWRNFSC